jgi:hypothetical protein
MDSELRSVVLGVAAAAVITPLLGRWLSRAFPPKVRDENDGVTQHRCRNAVIEWIGTLFFVGASVPLLIQGTDRSRRMRPTSCSGFPSVHCSLSCSIQLFGRIVSVGEGARSMSCIPLY